MKDRKSLDYWRTVFRSTKTSVLDIIESAIRVARADHPDELAARRDRIAEVLYTCRRCHCDRAADEQRESSSGATSPATACTDDRTKAEADVPGTPGASFIGKEFDAGGNLAGDSAAANSEMKDRMSLDYWRSLFCCTRTSVCDIIESAIRLAAADHPDELAARRERITEVLYTCRRCHCDRAADEQRESSSGATTPATARTDRTKAEGDVPGTPGASLIGKEFDAGGNLAGDSAAANSEIRGEFDKGSGSKPSEEQVPAQLIGHEDTGAKRKREDATNESPVPASGETMKCPQDQNRGQS